MYLGVLAAIRARLEGRHRKFVAGMPDMDREWDYQQTDREDGINRDAMIEAYLKKDIYTTVAKQRVPIFLFDIEGQRFEEVYPSIAFEILDVTPRYNEYIYQAPLDEYPGDAYQKPINYAKDTVSLDGETPVTTAPQVELREVEQPYNVMFEVRSYSKDPIISALLVAYVYDVFKPRDYIRVPHKDGSFRSWDLMFEGYRDLDKRDAVRSGTPGVEREYAKVITYTIEAYLDNTDTTDLVSTVKSRTINMQKTATSA